MLKKNCPNCHKPLTLPAVILAINPARIPCRHCKHAIKIHTPHAISALAITIFASIGLLSFMTINNVSQYLLWPALIVAGGLFEILYFYFIHKGVIKSNLANASELSPQNTQQ